MNPDTEKALYRLKDRNSVKFLFVADNYFSLLVMFSNKQTTAKNTARKLRFALRDVIHLYRRIPVDIY